MAVDHKTQDIILTAVGIFEYLANHLTSYSSLLEESLVRGQAEIENPYSSHVPRPRELDFDYHWGIEVFYPTTLRESLFVASFSHFETIMNKLCVEIGQAQKYSVTLSDLNGRGVHRMRTYLTKVAKLAVPDSDWATVTFLNSLRNLIVHNNSQIQPGNKDHDRIRKSAADWPTVEIPEDGRIKFGGGFNDKALDTFLDFFDHLRRNNTRFAA